MVMTRSGGSGRRMLVKGSSNSKGKTQCYQNRTIHDSIHESINDSGGVRSDSFKESKICMNRRLNCKSIHGIQFNINSQGTRKLKSYKNKN